MKCCICKKEITGYGNNPYPVKAKGYCCDECNMKYVLPVRMLLAYSAKKGEKKHD